MMEKRIKVSLALVLFSSGVFAQRIDDAKRAIDAEQYQQASVTLKNLIAAQPAKGENYFYLGNVYLLTEYPDSAKIVYSRGISAEPAYTLNYVGLGAVALENGDQEAARYNFEKATAKLGKRDYKEYMHIGKAYLYSPANYDQAITWLEKARSINEKDAELFLALGQAYRGQKRSSEAYSAYRTAYDLDNKMLRAKVELGVINKLSRAYPESVTEFNAVLAIDPNYGPAYRELAETYYLWANASPAAEYDTKIKEALSYYEKYMDLTDRSLDSRMRHADFLLLAKEYQALEAEANAMAALDKVNPRVLRYLGYSAYENGNYEASEQALVEFMSKVDPKRIISKDYLYLGLAQFKNEKTAEAIENFKTAVEMDPANAEKMSEIGQVIFKSKNYDQAAQIFAIAILNKSSKTLVFDHFYLGYSHYFDYATKSAAKEDPSLEILQEADSAFAFVTENSPTTQDAHLYRARINRLLDSETEPEGKMIPFYEKYVEVVNAKGEAEQTKAKNNLIEAYSNLGAYFIVTDQAKAKEYLSKVVELDPNNAYATEALRAIEADKK